MAPQLEQAHHWSLMPHAAADHAAPHARRGPPLTSAPCRCRCAPAGKVEARHEGLDRAERRLAALAAVRPATSAVAAELAATWAALHAAYRERRAAALPCAVPGRDWVGPGLVC